MGKGERGGTTGMRIQCKNHREENATNNFRAKFDTQNLILYLALHETFF